MTDSPQLDPKPDPPAPSRSPEPTPAPAPTEEAPDRDTPAWEGADPDDAVGLVDPRREIPSPPGL